MEACNMPPAVVGCMRLYPAATYLPLLQLCVQPLLQVDDIQACGWCAGHSLHPQLPVLSPFPAGWHPECQLSVKWNLCGTILGQTTAACLPGWEDGVEDVLCLCD
jgi:hypothetical protein